MPSLRPEACGKHQIPRLGNADNWHLSHPSALTRF